MIVLLLAITGPLNAQDVGLRFGSAAEWEEKRARAEANLRNTSRIGYFQYFFDDLRADAGNATLPRPFEASDPRPQEEFLRLYVRTGREVVERKLTPRVRRQFLLGTRWAGYSYLSRLRRWSEQPEVTRKWNEALNELLQLTAWEADRADPLPRLQLLDEVMKEINAWVTCTQRWNTPLDGLTIDHWRRLTERYAVTYREAGTRSRTPPAVFSSRVKHCEDQRREHLR